MTNAQIILTESFRLMEEGILKGSGTFGETPDGQMVELPEDIHTFNGWKQLGYSVKKGEKAVAKFPIWKHTRKMMKTDTPDPEMNKANAMINDQGGKTSMFMQTAAWFTASQVEPIKA